MASFDIWRNVARILVVEDEAKVAGALSEGLTGEGYDVVVATTGEDAFFLATRRPSN